MLSDALYKLGSDIICFFNHHLFLSVCSNLDIVPTGLLIKKKACVGNMSIFAMSIWEATLKTTGSYLVNILKEEYRIKLRFALIEFWNLLPLVLEATQTVRNLFVGLFNLVINLQENKEYKRSRKLLSLYPSIDISNLPLSGVENFTFFEDLCHVVEPICDVIMEEVEGTFVEEVSVNIVTGMEICDNNNVQINDNIGISNNLDILINLVTRDLEPCVNTEMENSRLDNNNCIEEQVFLENVRLKGKFVSPNVINLSNRELTYRV